MAGPDDPVTAVWLFTQTGTGEHAGSPAWLELQIRPTGAAEIELSTKSQQSSRNGIASPGESAIFHWEKGTTSWNLTRGNVAEIRLQIAGPDADDAWLPTSIWVVFETAQEETLVVGYPSWGYHCFSSDTTDCGGNAEPVYTLYPKG